MANNPVTITIDPDSEPGRCLAEAGPQPVTVVSRGVRYRIEPEDPLTYYDPEQARQALRQVRGIFKGVDTKQLLADLGEQRG